MGLIQKFLFIICFGVNFEFFFCVRTTFEYDSDVNFFDFFIWCTSKVKKRGVCGEGGEGEIAARRIKKNDSANLEDFIKNLTKIDSRNVYLRMNEIE